MEIMLTPAVNLLGCILLNFKVYGKKEVTVTAIVPEFLAEGFFNEYNNFDIDAMQSQCETVSDIEAFYPELYRYVFSQVCEEVDYRDIEHAEILWAIDMGIPPGMPTYIQGYEL